MKRIFPLLVGVIISAACAAPAVSPTAQVAIVTATATSTTAVAEAPPPTPRSTPEPTSTPSPTSRSTPTPTPSPTATPTPLPHDVPPVIHVEAPSDAITGERVVLDASATFDYDGDEITYQWRQVHNPDRYAGTEYVTGNDVTLENYDQPITAFTPQWPGNYRFEIVASDKDGESKQRLDVLIHLSEQRFTYRGVALEWWYYYEPNSADLGPMLLDRVVADGANVVELALVWWMPDRQSNDILPCDVGTTLRQCHGAMSDESLIRLINEAHARNLLVLLAPQVQGNGDGYWWSGFVQPPSWEEWFENYRALILHYARIAEDNGVWMLQIGNELESSQEYVEEWRRIISDVREVYHGYLTYGKTNLWFPLSWQPDIEWWNELDYIGLHFWFPGTANSFLEGWDQTPAFMAQSAAPSVNQMVRNFETQLTWRVDSLAQRLQMPVLVTELGCYNFDGANWDSFPSGVDIKTLPTDNQEQADYYEAALRVLSSRPYVEGVILWGFEYRPHTWRLALDPRDKPGEDVIRLWYGQ